MSRAQLLGLSQFVALLIALVMPVTPSRTGSDWSPAEAFFADPSYVQEVLVYFGFTNLLMGVLALVVVVLARRQERRGGE